MIELKQSRIAFVGLPDSGKSRFIQEFVKWYSGRKLDAYLSKDVELWNSVQNNNILKKL